MKALIRSSVIVTGIRGVGIVLQSLVLLFLARTLPVQDLGIFALFYAGFGIARILGPLGADQVTMRRAAVAGGAFDEELHRVLNTSFVLVVGVNAAVAALLAAVAFLAFPSLLANTGLSTPQLLIVAASLPAFAIIGLMTYQLRGFNLNALAQFPDSIVLQLALGGSVAVFSLLGNLDLATALLSLVGAAWLVVIIYLAIRLRLGVDLSVGPRWATTKSLFRESRAVLYALSVTTISGRVPLLLSAPLLGSAATAIFDLAARFGSVPSITTSAVTAAFSPRFAELAHTRQCGTVSRTLSVSSLVAVAPALLCFVVIAVAAPYLIEAVLPPVYGHIYVPMLVVCAAATVNACFGVTSSLLFMAGQSHVVRNFSFAQLATVCILTPPLALAFGPLGLACVALASSIVRDLGMAIWASRTFGIALPPFGIRRTGQPQIRESGELA